MNIPSSEILSGLLATIGVLGSALFVYLANKRTKGQKKADNYSWVVEETKSLYAIVHEELEAAKTEIRNAKKAFGRAEERIRHLEKEVMKKETILKLKDDEIRMLKNKILQLEKRK